MTPRDETPDERQATALPSDPEELREEIAATRDDLGATVQALADKADVKARAREKIDEGKQQAEKAAHQAVDQVRRRPIVFAAAGAFLAGVVIGLLVRRRK